MVTPNIPEKERLVKDDGRYIVFYDFKQKTGEKDVETEGEQQ